MSEPMFVTVDEAARILRISISSMRARVRRGDLPVFRLRHSRLIRLRHADVEGLVVEEPPPATAMEKAQRHLRMVEK